MQAKNKTPEQNDMTDEQRESLKTQRRRYAIRWTVAGLGTLTPLYLFTQTAQNSFACAAIIFSSFSLFAIGAAIRKWTRAAYDLQTGVVGYLEGRVATDIQYGSNGLRAYHLRINGQEFEISPARFSSITHQGRYRVSYSPRSRFVLSIEPL